MPDWKSIIIHHSATDDDGEREDWELIRRFHMSWRLNGETLTPDELEAYFAARKLLGSAPVPAGWKWAGVQKPWKNISYHWGVESIKGKIVIQKGREIDQIGAHCIGMNGQAIGICCVGDFDQERPSDKIYLNCAQLCVSMIRMFPVITPWSIYPHSKFAEKTCPGKLFDMDRLVKYVKCYLGSGGF